MIHPLAHCDGSCVIGPGTKVWQFASVIRASFVGQRCNVGSCAIIDAARVGDDVTIGHGAQLHPGTYIWHRVFIGPAVVFCNDRWPTVSKDGFEIDRLLKAALSSKDKTVEVLSDASIGANSTILPGLKIGQGAMIAAGANVDRDVPDFHLFKRDGSIVRIDKRQNARMRFAA